MKKHFIFSDVHGEFTALLGSLSKAGFEPENEDHILVSLGDMFDRGNENHKVLEFLMDYDSKGRLMSVCGNHDDMLIQFLIGRSDGIFNCERNGMDKTLRDLSGLDNIWKFLGTMPQVITDKINERYPGILKFLISMKSRVDVGDYIMVHAGYSPASMNEDETEWFIDNWANTPMFVSYFPESPMWQGDKKYVFGHWHASKLKATFGVEPNDDTIFRRNNFIGLDTKTNISKSVNILVLKDGKETNEHNN